MKLGHDPQSALVLTPLERAVLARLAAGLGEAGAVIGAQASQARVVSRSHSGVGFVTRLAVPEGLAALAADAARRLPVVRARHPLLTGGAEFVVQLKAGRLATIEAFCQDGMWPADDAGFVIEPPAGL